jgi:DNA-binding NtrC family response regulator
MLTASDIRRFLPEHRENRLPALTTRSSGNPQDFMNERDILYKLFFDMKKDVNELKKMIREIVQNPSLAGSLLNSETLLHDMSAEHADIESSVIKPMLPASSQPVYLPQNSIQDHVEVEESLNIMDMEKDLIEKALRKHKGKRKDAASDLGISERTLYRKLKEYDIEN